MESATEEWEALYERLLDTLGEFGKDLSVDAGCDYFVIDDDYGCKCHKIEVLQPDFWSATIQRRITEILATSFPDWGVLVVFGGGAHGRRGFILYADRVEFGPSASAANEN